MKIVELQKETYKGYEIQVFYTTKAYHHVKIKKSKNIHLTIKRKKVFRKLEKSFMINLFEDYIEQSRAFGIFERRKLIAIVEGSIESWHNVYRIYNIYVSKRYRKEGFGTALFEHIEQVAKSVNARALVLEVQSCNDPAIQFYKKQDLHFVGLNTMEYTNEDIQRKEVRLEYGKRL
jgi:ribosomal protein S18 acetylase RimI-like enzyme